MVDEPDGNNEHAKADSGGGRSVGPDILPDTAKADNRAGEPSQEHDGPPHIVRAFIAARRRIGGLWNYVRRFGGWLDRHSGTTSALATVAIAVLTAFYVKYSKAQWESLRESNALTRQIAETQQRAWLVIEHIGASPAGWVPDVVVTIDIDIKNAGLSPAVASIVKGYIILAGPFPSDPDIKDRPELGEPARIVIGPGLAGNTKLILPPLTAEVIDNIRSGRFALYVFGAIHYRDIFTMDRETTFCAVFNPDIGKFGGCSTFNTFR